MLIVMVTLFLAAIIDWSWRVWNRSRDAKRRSKAEKVLHKHGLVAYTYLASFGIDDVELRDALSVLEVTSKVILDPRGCLVGRLLPKTQESGPGLRLVVDNTKP